MWLVYIKILYDNFSLVKLLVWAFIIYIIIGTIYLSWGWIGIIVLVLLIIAFVIYILMLSKKQRKRKTQINNNVVNNVYNFSKTHNLKKVEVKPCHKFKKNYSNEEAKLILDNTLKKYPGSVSDVSWQDGDPLYRVYWLAVSENGNKKDEPGMKQFDVKFAIDKDNQEMAITITNICNEILDVEWKFLTINRRKVQIDGIHWMDYKESGIIESGKSVTKTVQPADYNEKILNLDRIKKEELEYKVSFNVKCGKKASRKYIYTVYTKMRVIF